MKKLGTVVCLCLLASACGGASETVAPTTTTVAPTTTTVAPTTTAASTTTVVPTTTVAPTTRAAPTTTPTAPTTTISLPSSTTVASSQPELLETDPVLILPFTAAEDPLRIMPMGETVNHDPPKGHPGIDFQWEGSATVRASLPGEVVEITQTEPNDFAVSVINGLFVVHYKHLGSVAGGLGVGDEIDYGEPIGNPMSIQGTP